MTKTTSTLPSRVALLCLLGATACGTLITLDPVTEAQAAAIQWSQKLAAVKHVQLDGVVFEDPPKDVPNAGAWAVCGKRIVGWNRHWIEEPSAMGWIPAYAAHEICHLHYKDNLPCKLYGVGGKQAMEERATQCGIELLAAVENP